MSKRAESRVARKEEPAFPVVGIGASAGGLEAVSRLLSRLPARTGMAFVVVQHLDPTRDSLLPSILQKATSMPVSQAADGTPIARDRVYVIPPNAHMVISGGVLRLIPRPAGVHALAVNCFLNSLAEQRGEKAVAVILSGTASDGALGVKAVKAEGGVVFAQDEASAGHFGMPQSAAATGAVDFVLPPEKIAEELAELARRPLRGLAIAELFEDTDSLTHIFQLLRRSTGVDFSQYKSSTIKRRLVRRLMVHKLESLARYRAVLEKTPREIRALHDDLLIHVTHFFREPRAMAALRSKAFGRILKSLPADAPIRVWVPGCSTGEEAYTIAIELFDYLSESDSMNPVQIFATDISELALERARKGLYSEEIKDFVPSRLLRRFFTKVDGGYEIVKRVRDACVFARQDLTKDPPFANVDLISCCNVLIYLGPAIQKQILPMFHYALRPSGVLLLGSSETVGEHSDLFEPADKKCRLYFKKPSARKVYFPIRMSSAAAREADSETKVPSGASSSWPDGDVQRQAERLLLARFAPAGVIVNEALEILHFRGHVGRFLEPNTGKANLNLLRMLPANAAAAMSQLVRRAKKTDAPAAVRGVELGDEARRARPIGIEAIPFRLPVSNERYFIVLFEDDAPAAGNPGKPAAPQPSEATAVRRLKGELSAVRSYLQTVVEEHEAVNEELKAANEEVVSSNEELQSTNEELEIAKEELQAANEELSTVNEELQTRNVDLGQLNNDLVNLISSVHLPIVMVSSDLRIRRFSSMAEKLMRLIPGDVGRPIGDIRPDIALPNIEEIIHEVIETVTTKELEVRDRADHSYALRIRPYKTVDNKIEGAVLVFIDNDPIKRGSAAINEVSAFEAVLEIAAEPLTILDSDLRVKAGSRSMYQVLGLTESSLGRSLFEIEGGRWNEPELRTRLERLATAGEPFDRVRVLVGTRRFLFSGRRIKGAAGGPPLILLSVNDLL